MRTSMTTTYGHERERPRRSEGVEEATRRAEIAWVSDGVVAGFLGAFSVAVILLVADLLHGRPPLWTPVALGSALFLGKSVAAASIDPLASLPIVIGYTVLHGVVFAAFGCIAAFVLLASPDGRGLARLGSRVVAAVVLFGLFELTFLGFALVFAPGLLGPLGAGWVAFANAAAAVVMAGFFSWIEHSTRTADAPAGEQA